MLRKLAIAIAILAGIFAGIFWILTIPKIVSRSELGPHTADLENGRILFHAGGCASCHAIPKQEDKSRLGGGLPLPSAFGTFYAPNISPDPTDGIGEWTEAQFVTALKEGTSPSGEHLYPAFPYTSYRQVAVDDLRDLFAYLKTLPAVAGRTPDHQLPFPLGFRRGLGIWKLLFLDGGKFRPDPQKSPAFERGAYLVNGAGHCAECHSPRNVLGAVIAGLRFTGGPNPAGRGWVPNITQQELKDWSEPDIANLLETGETPEGDRVGSSMAEVVRSTTQLPAQDRAAIAAYVKSLPPVEGLKPPRKHEHHEH
ncbi:MAG: c-type cytochrome [Alphaproteobacteria bacterium]|nr:MAG: c-type cytochrome [Alphaproteobacteria bacterium]